MPNLTYSPPGVGFFDGRYLRIVNNLSDLDNAATARTNLGLVSGGAGDIWVEKVGDLMTSTLEINAPTATDDVLILKSTDNNTTKRAIRLENAAGAEIAFQRSDGTWALSNNLFYGVKDTGGALRNTLTINSSNNCAVGPGGGVNKTTLLGGSAVGLTVDNSGNVGINRSSSIRARLDIVGSADDEQLIVQANATQNEPLVQLQDSSGNVHHEFNLPGATDPNTYFNKQLGDLDTIIAGDTEANLFRVDAGLDAIHIGDWDTNYISIDKEGDTWWVGTGGLVFGDMCIPGVDIVVVTGDANPHEVTNAAGDGWATGELNLVTFPTGGDEHYLTVPEPGRYEVVWSLSGHTGAGGATGIHGGIMIDGVALRDDGEAHRDVSNSNDDGNMGSSSIIDCPNGTEQISLWVSVANSNEFHAEHGTMTIKQIGGT